MKKNSKVFLNILAMAIGMFGMAYASVPLYNIFCRATGYGGTTQTGKMAPDKYLDRKIKVLFNTDVSPELDWRFKKLQDSAVVHVGETKLIFFEATNVGTKPLVGVAQYNVAPAKMRQYFVKLECFCFHQQIIRPGEKVTFPVSFFIDPSIMDDKTLDDVSQATLSYTFFKYKDQDVNQFTSDGQLKKQADK